MALRTALLSLHSHADRSFLDDPVLALLSGDLRSRGHESDVVVAVLEPPDDLRGLVAVLGEYDVVAYERIWSRTLAARLQEALPNAVLVHLVGEHVLEDPPADFVCEGELRRTLPALLDHLGGQGPLPRGCRVRTESGFRVGLGALDDGPLVYRPNLRPRVLGAIPPPTRFDLEGNEGCPYQTDARESPVYRGVSIPARYGLGCAFCTTGNRYQGRPAEDAAEHVLTQLRYVRREAPERTALVLRDQNPFAYLPALMEACVAEGLTGFTLLLQTRADWMLRSEARFERALTLAHRAGVRISPFLVGIESFSQPELDRFNKGIDVETNFRFLEAVRRWEREHPAFDLEHASFGFILFSPWTTMEDLRTNYEGIVRSGLDRLRGRILLSVARLYPDTALYYLAERDGLLMAGEAEGRYGYFPPAPFRFADPRVARFAALAAELSERTGGRDERLLFRALLDAFEEVGAEDVGAEDVLARWDEARGRAVSEAHLGRGCGCALCAASGPSVEAAPRARRIVLHGWGDDTELLGRAALDARRRGFREVVAAGHAAPFAEPEAAARLAASGVDALQVPIASHVARIHDRIEGAPGALAMTLVGMRSLARAGLPIELVVPRLAARVQDPDAVVELAHRALPTLRAVVFTRSRDLDGLTRALARCRELELPVRVEGEAERSAGQGTRISQLAGKPSRSSVR